MFGEWDGLAFSPARAAAAEMQERVEALLKRVRDLALGVGLVGAARLADDLLRRLGPIEQKETVVATME